jgi:hypothetical protein
MECGEGDGLMGGGKGECGKEEKKYFQKNGPIRPRYQIMYYLYLHKATGYKTSSLG